MRRTWRGMLNASSVLLLLLCLATMGLWVRSLSATDYWDWRSTENPKDAHDWIHSRRWWWCVSGGGIWFDRHYIQRQRDAGEVFQRDDLTDSFIHTVREPEKYPYLVPLPVGGNGITVRRQPFVNLLGFGAQRTRVMWSSATPRHDSHFTITVPLWFLVATFGVLPAVRIFRYRRKRLRARREAAGLCIVCGYDLRATRDRCPECGTLPAEARE